jgi:hypothetical protein
MKFELGKVYTNPFVKAFKPQVSEETQDHEVGMANGQLDYIIKAATELKQKLGNDEKEIPGWIQDHISKAHSYIHQANSGYHELGDKESVNEGILTTTAIVATAALLFKILGWSAKTVANDDKINAKLPKDLLKKLTDETIKLYLKKELDVHAAAALKEYITNGINSGKITTVKQIIIIVNSASQDDSKKNTVAKTTPKNYFTDKWRKYGLNNFDESVNENITEPKIITQLRDVVKSGYKKLKCPKTGRTMTVDSYSASAITKVYDALKDPKNKEKFSSAGLLGMQSMAFKLIK